MTLLDKLEWAHHTINEQLRFGLPEEQAIKARERRVKGVLVDAIAEVRRLQGELTAAGYLLSMGQDNKAMDLKDFKLMSALCSEKEWWNEKAAR